MSEALGWVSSVGDKLHRLLSVPKGPKQKLKLCSPCSSGGGRGTVFARNGWEAPEVTKCCKIRLPAQSPSFYNSG